MSTIPTDVEALAALENAGGWQEQLAKLKPDRFRDRKTHDWSMEEYKEVQAANQTVLRAMESENAPFAEEIWKGTKPDDETDAKRRGTILHLAMQYQDEWPDMVEVVPDRLVEGDALEQVREEWANRNSKATLEVGEKINARLEPHRRWLELIKLEAGKAWLTHDEYKICKEQVESLLTNPVLEPYFEQSYLKEQARTAVHDRTGLLCKILCDAEFPDTIIDFKTTRMKNDYQWERDAKKKGYPFGAGFYLDVSGKQNFLWVAVRNERPIWSSVYEPSPRALEAAREQTERALYSLSLCIQQDCFLPLGYGAIVELDFD